MDDLISRQAAIAAIQNLYSGMPRTNVFNSLNRWREKNRQFIECEYVINLLPPVKRKKGEWVDMGDYCVCNQCWHTEQQFNGVEPIPLHTPFCAMCGADMREEKNDVGSKM